MNLLSCIRGPSKTGDSCNCFFCQSYSYTSAKNMSVGGFATQSWLRCACVTVCAWYLPMDWHPIKDVFLPHSQCSWDTLCIHCDPDQDKVATENQWLSVWICMHVALEQTGIPSGVYSHLTASDLWILSTTLTRIACSLKIHEWTIRYVSMPKKKIWAVFIVSVNASL